MGYSASKSTILPIYQLRLQCATNNTLQNNINYSLIIFITQEAYERLVINGEALSRNEVTPIPLSNGVIAHALHVIELTQHVS